MKFRPRSEWQVVDGSGRRKYLTAAERDRLLAAADRARPDIRLLCYVLALTGCRISEALALTPDQHDVEAGTLRFRTLKRRKVCFRTVPVPPILSAMLIARDNGQVSYWSMHRSTAWRQLKRLLAAENIFGPMACCRGFRHGYGIHAAASYVPPNLIQRWMGHASAQTTSIYLDAVGTEEREFAARMW